MSYCFLFVYLSVSLAARVVVLMLLCFGLVTDESLVSYVCEMTYGCAALD